MLRAGIGDDAVVAEVGRHLRRASAGLIQNNPYPAPWDRMTEQPVLVIGSTFDPATAFGSSVRLAQELGDARLLPVNGFGHTVLFNPNRCAQDYVADYLIRLKPPPTGAACGEDRPPFGN